MTVFAAAVAALLALGAGLSFVLQQAVNAVLRGDQDAKTASIWMRKCRRVRDGRRA
ncbi:MAG: hypothetical protein JO001_23595 [Alphaproteobacteria bacterium]|nr:hypothetical protein [Alphaproteobacteria bacterium]